MTPPNPPEVPFDTVEANLRLAFLARLRDVRDEKVQPYKVVEEFMELHRTALQALVTAQKPEKYEVPSLENKRIPSFDDVREQARDIGYNQALQEFETNLLKALKGENDDQV